MKKIFVFGSNLAGSATLLRRLRMSESERRPKPHRPRIDFRVGDEWGFLTNNGVLHRRIVAIEDGRVFYRGFGSTTEHECAIKTFQRWLRGAELTFAADWSGRDLNGRADSQHSPGSPQ